jgi:6-phosphogluconolactonase
MKIILTNLLLLTIGFALGQQKYYLVTGTYTNGKGEGVYIHEFNAGSGDSRQLNVVRGIKNPSYLAVSPDEKYVYVVSELNGGGDAGMVNAYAFNKATGNMKFINSVRSGGDDPCYVTVDRSGNWVFVGNYSSGSLKMISSENGSLKESSDPIKHTGSGINKDRQEKPHVHSTVLSADNRFLYAPDLGIDKIMIYAFDAKKGTLSNVGEAAVDPGGGPRHIIFHPNGRYAYLVEEMKGNVSVFSVNQKSGALTKVQTISSAAKGFTGDMGSADIHITKDGKFLYASNRGAANDIAIFAVDPSNGTLSHKSNQSVMGIAPRNFSLDPTEKFLLVANQRSDEIVIFKRDKKTGMLSDSGKRIAVPTPVCLTWIKY